MFLLRLFWTLGLDKAVKSSTLPLHSSALPQRQLSLMIPQFTTLHKYNMQEICTSLMVVCALFTYCVSCYIDTSMMICINQSTFNNVRFVIGYGHRITYLRMATSRSGYLSEYTADGNFRHYLFHLQEDVLSLIPPADKNKALLQAKWKSAIGHAFNAFTDKRTMHKTAAEIVEVITQKVAEIATEAHGHGHHRGLWCESITMADLQAMIYRPAYASCLKHHSHEFC